MVCSGLYEQINDMMMMSDVRDGQIDRHQVRPYVFLLQVKYAYDAHFTIRCIFYFWR